MPAPGSDAPRRRAQAMAGCALLSGSPDKVRVLLMDETVSQIHASRLAQAYSLAAARGWTLAPRPVTIAELAAGAPLVDRPGSGKHGGIEQGTALVAYFVRRERIVLPAAIVMIGSRDLLDWARFNVSRSAPAVLRESFATADGDSVLVLTPAAA